MKRIFIIIALAIACSATANAQDNEKPRLSAFTRQYMSARKGSNEKAMVPQYVYKRINNRVYLSAFIKVGPSVDEAALTDLGVYVGTRAGSVWTVQVPVEKVGQFITVAGIKYIELDAAIKPYLDTARVVTRADSAHAGIYLSAPATGKNVVVGIIDAGFDFTHPTMYDTTHSQYRIKKVWNQKTSGTPPSGVAYGSEYTDSNAIRARGYDTAITSHGSHVAGIAAGSGDGSTNTRGFRGMAPESDMVIVGIMPAPEQWAAAGESDIIDGMSYIYNYAASVGKPAVVNLSWGSTIGPHDGLSLFSQACDALTGPGKIFVCAAGNNGTDLVHLKKVFTTTDTTVSTFVTFSSELDTASKQTWVDIWGDTGSVFCLNVKLYQSTTVVDSTVFLCVADTTRTFYLIGSNSDTCFVTMTMAAPDYNGKPHAILYLHSRVHDNVCLTARSSGGTVNMWEGYVIPPHGYYGYLKSLGYSWARSGDVNMTVSDIGCTRSAITTAAYTSKLYFTNIDGTLLHYTGTPGVIASFSSRGPTEDGRIKPDISAPGFALASAISSYDTSYGPGGTNYISVVKADTIGSTIYRYAMAAGTSMASPCAAGIIAMMLQMDPTLTPDGVRDILANTAITDTYTGTLPAAGNSTWGHGKINAYKALRYMAGTLSVENTLAADPLSCMLYPNPNKGSFTIDYKSDVSEPLTIQVTDITGKLVAVEYWLVNPGGNSRRIDIAGLSKGVYLVKVSSLKGYKVMKMSVN